MGGALDPSVATIRRAVRDECADLEPGTRVIVASSGGADSLALAAAASFEGRRAGWLVGGAVVDHGMQDGSAAVAANAAATLGLLGCDPVDVIAVEVGTVGGPEAAAREARYHALESAAAERSATVLLGHTLDDQAETVLLGLARGSGTRSLAGMPRRRGPFRRPFLDIPRETVRSAVDALGLVPWQDPHNADTRFSRVRARQSVLPVLERDLGPGVAAALGRTARLARADADALDNWAAQAHGDAETDSATLAIDVLAALPEAVRSRVIRLAIVKAGAPPTDLTAAHVGGVEALLDEWHGQRGVDLPGRLTARRVGLVIRFDRAPAT